MRRRATPTDALPELTPGELVRYARHLALEQVGVEGQRRLKGGRVLVVGMGGLGSPVALYLAAAGVGTLGLVDFDVVDVGNLQRQLLHGTGDVGRKKVESARDRLREVNPGVQVVTHELRLDAGSAPELIRGYDLVVDATDDFAARYALSDACVAQGKADVYGAVTRFEGLVSIFGAPGGPCLRCLHRDPPPPGLIPPAAETGILGVVPGLVGLLQAAEVVKLLAGAGEPLVGRLLMVDLLRMEFRSVRLAPDPACPACGSAPDR